MKHLLIIILLSTLSAPVLAHPGSSTLVCKSVKNSGAKQSLQVFVKRANGIGWGTPTIEISVDAKMTEFQTPDDMSHYGETFHNSPLKVIKVSVAVPESEDDANSAIFQVVAIPESVKAFDEEGKPVEWSLEAENDPCYDVHGSAKFKGVIRGYIQNKSNDTFTDIEAQVLDCTLSYNPGMSC